MIYDILSIIYYISYIIYIKYYILHIIYHILYNIFLYFIYHIIYIRIYESGSRIPIPPPNGMVPHPPPYLIHFAHTTVTKLTFPYFCMHTAVARRTFSFCWMNPLAGFGGSIARNCGEMQILSSRSCSAQCTGRFNA